MFNNNKSRWQRRKEAKERWANANKTNANEEKKAEEVKEEKKEEKAEVPLWAQNAELERRAEPEPVKAEPVKEKEHHVGFSDYSSQSEYWGNSDDYGYSGFHWPKPTSNWGSGGGSSWSYGTTYTSSIYTPTVKFEFTDDFKSNSSMEYWCLEDVVKGTTCDFKIITTCVEKGSYETFITCDSNSKVVGHYKSVEKAKEWHKKYVTDEVPKHQKAFYMYTTIWTG
jgi:hypothetical protein